MKSILTLTLFIHLAIICLAQDTQSLLVKSYKCAEENDYSCAEKHILEVIAIEKDKAKLSNYYSNLGTFQRRMNRIDEALESYNKAIQLDNKNVDALTNRATLFSQMNDDAKALKDYNAALKIAPNDETSLINRASIYRKSGKQSEAKKDLEVILKKDPKNIGARVNLANIKKSENKNQEALSDYNSLISDYPDEAILYNNRADTYLILNKLNEALLDVNKALELDSEYSTAHLTKGEILLKLKDDVKACHSFHTAISLGIDQARISHLMENCK